MKYFASQEFGRIITISLQRGDKVLPSIQTTIDELGIRSAVVVSGIGSLRTAEYHIIGSLTDRAEDVFFDLEAPMEMGSVQGLILEGVPHLHYTFSEKDKTYTAHLEPETVVQYLAEIVLLEVKDMDLVRRRNEFGVAYIADPNA